MSLRIIYECKMNDLQASELCYLQHITHDNIYNGTLCCSSQKACLTVEENTRLKSRLQAAEAEVVQRQTSSAEQDYEEVIQLLEAEIKDLKNQLASRRQVRGVEATKVSLKAVTHCFYYTLSYFILFTIFYFYYTVLLPSLLLLVILQIQILDTKHLINKY